MTSFHHPLALVTVLVGLSMPASCFRGNSRFHNTRSIYTRPPYELSGELGGILRGDGGRGLAEHVLGVGRGVGGFAAEVARSANGSSSIVRCDIERRCRSS